MPAPSITLHPYRDANGGAVQSSLEPGKLRASSDLSSENQERASAHDPSECGRPGSTRTNARRTQAVRWGAGLFLHLERRRVAGIAWLVSDRSRRGEDRGLYVALQPAYLCQ